MKSGSSNVLLIFIAAFVVTLPIFLLGVPKGNDLPQHFQFALVFRESITQGVLSPSWASNVNSGFGDVGVRFYPPLAYYLLDLFYTVCGNWVYATAATVWLLFFVGGTGAFLWCREWFGQRASLVGGLLFILVPYHVNEIYNAFTFAEFAAACVLPFCFLYVTRVIRRGALNDIAGLAVSFAALVLTNLPLLVIGSISLAIYALALLWQTGRLRQVGSLAVAVAASLILSAFYWVRIVSELPFLNHTGDGFVSGDYDFRNNFVWSFFYASADQYSERSLGFLDLMLAVTIAMALAGLIVFYSRSSGSMRGPMTGPLAVLVTGLFFATPLSVPIWERISILQKTQFPWRWLAVISLLCCVAVAAGVEWISDLRDPASRRFALVLGGFAIAAVTFTAAQVIRPAIFLDVTSFNKTLETFASANSCECWWPVWARKEALADTALVASNGRNIAVESWEPTARVFQLSAGDSATARVATFYYPNWYAYVNGRAENVTHDANGAIVIPVPTERARVELYFREPTLGRTANWLSGGAWLCLLAFWTYRAARTRRSNLR